jgi:hypothetical protein
LLGRGIVVVEMGCLQVGLGAGYLEIAGLAWFELMREVDLIWGCDGIGMVGEYGLK